MFGMIAGRLSLFKNIPQSISLWKKITLWSALLFIPLNVARMVYPDIAQGNKALLMPLDIAIPSICNFLFMGLLVGCFILLWYDKGNGYKFQRLFIPFGKMSLTNYITQSIIGITLFYGFGFNLSLNPQLHSRSATYIKRNGLLIRKITIKSSRPFQCAYHPLTP